MLHIFMLMDPRNVYDWFYFWISFRGGVPIFYGHNGLLGHNKQLNNLSIPKAN
jgi:hypothetical protein